MAFRIDPAGPDVTIDFDANLPVMIWRRFGLWDATGAKVAQTALDGWNPPGTPDFTFPASTAAPVKLVTILDCIGEPNLIGSLLKVTLIIRQGSQSEVRKIPAAALLAGGSGSDAFSQIKITNLQVIQ